MLACGCGESNEVLLRKMNTHKDNGRDLTWVHMCVSASVCMLLRPLSR